MSFAAPFLKKAIKFSLGTLVVANTMLSLANEAAPAAKDLSPEILAQLKIGLWDFREIMKNVGDSAAAEAALQKESLAAEEEVNKRKKELMQMNQQWEQDSAVLTEEAKQRKFAELQKEFQKKAADLQNTEMQIRMDLQKKQIEAVENIRRKASKVAEDLAKEKNLYGMIDISSTGITYLKNSVNYTNEVISIYNTKNGPGTASESLSKKDSSAKNKG